ncbi:MAG: glucosidase [Bacteroidota bacterium]|nr:glucosidase [Bacteroidota bacterium]
MDGNMPAEILRLADLRKNKLPTAAWGPYMSERQWGTVREDYSRDGNAWNYFSHDHARSRAYRWGEDGIGGITDSQCQLCFAPAFWNGRDPILKERLFGLSNPEGNHGEDVKELYYYLDNTPTHSYMKYLYKYPHAAFPYQKLVEENSRKGISEAEFELLDTGIFDDGNYYDIFITYAKIDAEDIGILIEIKNIGKAGSQLCVLPTLWYRKQWSPDLIPGKPGISLRGKSDGAACVIADHPGIGRYYLYFESAEQLLFTENETNRKRIYGASDETPFLKDTFHNAVINNDFTLFKNKTSGTKFSPFYRLTVAPGEGARLRLRLTRKNELADPFGCEYRDAIISRKKEADEFYDSILPANLALLERNIARQAYAGMLWNKQFYYYEVREWLKGDKGEPSPPAERLTGRNSKWKHLNNRDIISVPDKWEFPWYASWDLAFHMIVFAYIDPEFAKQQLILINREWYAHPDGQMPAYEWNFGDVNPPVQAWSAMRVYEIEKNRKGKGDIDFLKRIFHKLTINFTWWANQKDIEENYVFEGGFLGLDNIGVVDRDSIVQEGCILEQADGTSWMGMFATCMLEIALEIARYDNTYEDVAIKYFEQYTLIAESLNTNGLWDDNEGFFYDVLKYPDGHKRPLKVRSVVGLTSFFATLCLPAHSLDNLDQFRHGIEWFRNYCRARNLYEAVIKKEEKDVTERLISLIHIEKLKRLLNAVLDENEFLSGYGIRSVSKRHLKPYEIEINNQLHTLEYTPGESTSRIFGSNSNWRGPIWFPVNYLLIRSLNSYYLYFGDELKVEFPTGTGNFLNLHEVAFQLKMRLLRIFQADQDYSRPVFGRFRNFYQREENRDLILFHEYFHGETGMGLGASHQTGWTGLIAALIQEL